MPAARPLRLALAETVPLLVPDVGESVSQAALSPTVQDNVPVPVFEIVRDWVAGLDPPAVPVNAILLTLSPMTGLAVGAGLTVRETGMTCGVLVAPVAEIVMAAVYVPAASPVRLTPAEIESDSVVVVPEAGARLSQAALLLMLHDNVPPVGFLRLIDCAAGAIPPAIPEKLSAVGVSEILGVADVVPVMVRVTGVKVRFLWPFSPVIAMTMLVE